MRSFSPGVNAWAWEKGPRRPTEKTPDRLMRSRLSPFAPRKKRCFRGAKGDNLRHIPSAPTAPRERLPLRRTSSPAKRASGAITVQNRWIPSPATAARPRRHTRSRPPSVPVRVECGATSPYIRGSRWPWHVGRQRSDVPASASAGHRFFGSAGANRSRTNCRPCSRITGNVFSARYARSLGPRRNRLRKRLFARAEKRPSRPYCSAQIGSPQPEPAAQPGRAHLRSVLRARPTVQVRRPRRCRAGRP